MKKREKVLKNGYKEQRENIKYNYKMSSKTSYRIQNITRKLENHHSIFEIKREKERKKYKGRLVLKNMYIKYEMCIF